MYSLASVTSIVKTIFRELKLYRSLELEFTCVTGRLCELLIVYRHGFEWATLPFGLPSFFLSVKSFP